MILLVVGRIGPMSIPLQSVNHVQSAVGEPIYICGKRKDSQKTPHEWNVLSFQETIVALFRGHAKSVVHLHHGYRALVIGSLSRLLRARVVASQHSLFTSVSLRRRIVDFLKHSLAEILVCNSEATKDSLPRLLSRKAIVIYNGVDVGPVIARKARPSGYDILTVGRLVESKQVDTIIRMMVLLPASFRLRVLGDGPENQFLRDLASDLGVDSRVAFEGLVDRDVVENAMKESFVVVVASRHEGFCNVVVEAMTLGTPVVATSVGAIPEVAGDAVDLLPLRSTPNDFADQVLKVAGMDEAAWLKRSVQGQRAAEPYSIESNTETLASLYNNLLGKQSTETSERK